MKELTYQVSFNTPAFLGNAEQQAQWRTPPFKALIRQWWRVVKAADPKVNFNHRELLRAEKRLFGAAGDEDGTSGRSRVLLRLSCWAAGEMARVDRGAPVWHDEIPVNKDGKKEMGANVYLGYGPIGAGKDRSAIRPGLTATLRLRVHDEHSEEEEIRNAMQLAAWFGALGSRARNAWGALHIEGEGLKGFPELNIETVSEPAGVVKLSECLKRDWPHALGTDGETPLVWRLMKTGTNSQGQKTLASFDTWQDVMRELARIKIAFRTDPYFKFAGGGKDGHPIPQPRHILSYPAGANHSVKASGWRQDGRLANQLRFKVVRRAKGFAGVIAHFPCSLPNHMGALFTNGLPDQLEVWQKVHEILDSKDQRDKGLVRIKGAQA